MVSARECESSDADEGVAEFRRGRAAFRESRATAAVAAAAGDDDDAAGAGYSRGNGARKTTMTSTDGQTPASMAGGSCRIRR
jgi:hypothetical protein